MIKTVLLSLSVCTVFTITTLVPLSFAEDFPESNDQIESDGTGTATIKGEYVEETTVTYEIKNGLAIFEGDIILGEVPTDTDASGNISYGVIITGSYYRWPDNAVPYQIGDNVSSQTKLMVNDAIAFLDSETALTFIERTSDNAIQYPDYIEVVSDDDACWSYVGRQGRRQKLNVVSGCGWGSTVHEFCHALGMWHEHSREDRGGYVTINWENIESGKNHNFERHISDGDDVYDYDYGSIMHYSRYAFSDNGLPTITPLTPGVTIGQRDELSETDLRTLESMYGEILPSTVTITPIISLLLF